MTSDASAVTVGARTEAQALANAAGTAGKAPSVQHVQPWRWCLAGGFLDLYLDHHLVPEATGIEGRLAVLSCGAALHHAVASLTADGWHAVVVRLPNRAQPDHLAQVHVAHQIPVVGTVRDRHTIGILHTNRPPDPSTGIDGDTVWSITAAVQSTGTRLRLLRPAQVFELAIAADHDQRTAAAGPEGPSRYLSHNGDLIASQTHGHAAVIAILYGSEDSTLAWLRAGEALSAAWLTATELGISVMPLSATIVTATNRETMRRLLGGPGHPYLVLRLGTIESDDPTEPHTPRLPPEQTRNGGDVEVSAGRD
jgi:hypothetical protein